MEGEENERRTTLGENTWPVHGRPRGWSAGRRPAVRTGTAGRRADGADGRTDAGRGHTPSQSVGVGDARE